MECARAVFERFGEELIDKDVGPGPRTPWTLEAFRGTLGKEGHKEFLGSAGVLFWLDLFKWAMPNQGVNPMEIKSFAQEYFNPAPAEGGGFKWPRPIGVAVTEVDTPGPRGRMRKISGDVMIYAFCWAWSEAMVDDTNPKQAEVLASFKAAALHVPMDFYLFELTADVERDIFTKGFQLMEDARKDEERFAPSGWQVCCLFAQARVMQAARGDSSPQAVEEFLSGVSFAASSEYRIALGSKMTELYLGLFDKVTKAGLGPQIEEARLEFGRGSVFDQVSKLILIAQKAPEPDLDFIIDLLRLRLRQGRCGPNVGRVTLLKTELPICVMVAELVKFITAWFVFPAGSPEARLLATVATPSTWARSEDAPSNDVITAKGVVKRLVGFVKGLYTGAWDHILVSLAAHGLEAGRGPGEVLPHPAEDGGLPQALHRGV